MSHPALIQYFRDRFLAGEQFATITQARKQAAEILGHESPPGSSGTKLVDESVEAAIVRVARAIIKNSPTTHAVYDQLVNLLERQPNLGVRSSTSILQQAYSTPIPVAYLASTLAGIDAQTTVYEPTAGHGALLIAANPSKATVNEINPDRATDLRVQGYTVTEYDATDYCPERKYDVVIANPPFGRVRGWSRATSTV